MYRHKQAFAKHLFLLCSASLHSEPVCAKVKTESGHDSLTACLAGWSVKLSTNQLKTWARKWKNEETSWGVETDPHSYVPGSSPTKPFLNCCVAISIITRKTAQGECGVFSFWQISAHIFFFFFASEDCSIFLSFGLGFVLLLFSEELCRVSSSVVTEHIWNMNLACSRLQTL